MMRLAFLLLAHCALGFNVAIFMPFHPSQKQMLLANVASWKDMVPCATHTNVDLILYSNAGLHNDILAETRGLIRKCFRNVTQASADIPPEYDTYEAGAPITQFFGMFDHEYLRLPKYDYVMLMEPDTRPVQAMWLDQLLIEIDKAHPFYARGSVARYDTSEAPALNGNAIYNYNSLDWFRFLCASFGAHKQYGSFDMSIHAHIMQTRSFYMLTMYHYTNYIHNNPIIGNLVEYIQDNPDTYLIHGKRTVAMIDELYPNAYSGKRIAPSPKHGKTRYEISPTGANVCRRLNFPQGSAKIRERQLPKHGGVPLASAPADIRVLLWSAPKPTIRGPLFDRQVNALKSWCKLEADVKLVLCGGYTEYLTDLQLVNDLIEAGGCGTVVSSCLARADGLPYLNSMVGAIDAIAQRDDVIVFVNGDCITMPTFGRIIKEAAFKMKPNYLIAGSRIGVKGDIEVGSPGWEHALGSLYRGTGSPYAIDVFAYSRHTFLHMPEFLHASYAWDNWMLANARVPAVDITYAGGVVWHQDHIPNRNATARDRSYNTKLAQKHGGWQGGTLTDLPYYMTLCPMAKPPSNDGVKEDMNIVQKRVRRFSGNPTLCMFKR